MKDKKNMFKKLKSIFIVEDEQFVQQSASASEIKEESKQVEYYQPTEIEKNIKIDHSEDNKFNNILLKVIEDNNIDGFDYLEFKNSIQTLSKAIPEEATQFKSAYEVGKTMGLTKQKLLETASFYADLLKQEDVKFTQAFNNQKNQQLHGREQEIKTHENEIIDFEKKIALLQKSIENHKNKITDLRAAMNESSEKLAQTHGEFKVAYQHLYNQIAQDIQKINEFIN